MASINRSSLTPQLHCTPMYSKRSAPRLTRCPESGTHSTSSRSRQFRIGLATSSPLTLAKIVTDKLLYRRLFRRRHLRGRAPFGKPHPQVYMDCAAALSADPLECFAFEDSFNGLIAAKAARMKCVVIPVADQYTLPKWGAADLKLASLLAISHRTSQPTAIKKAPNVVGPCMV